MEIVRLLKFPVLELITIAAIFFALSSALNFDYPSVTRFSDELSPSTLWQDQLNRFMKNLVWRHLAPYLGSYNYVAFIYAALTAMIAGDLSSGHMALIFSQPFRRSEIFMVRAGLTFLVPLVVYLLANSAIILIVGGLGCFLANPGYTQICYSLATTSFLYVFSVCLSLTLIVKETIPSFISSLMFLYGIDYAARIFQEKWVRILIPNTALTDFWFALGSPLLEESPPWSSLLTPMAISIALIAVCYLYFTRELEV